MLDFDNFTDRNNNKTIGGRIGFFPIPELELGYSLEYGRVDPGSPDDAHALIQSLDLNYVADVGPLKGRIDLRAQWVFSDVDTITYDPSGTLGFGPLTFSNERSGGYVQLAYRPKELKDSFFSPFESVIRFDMLDQPVGAPTGFSEKRLTVGLNYWMGPSAVLKVAYRFADVDDPAVVDNDAFLLQVAFGF